ncbi:hypothetical protein NQT62_08470 [Limnobacter humi]|uniref:Uncharacterized protein n=1 Tax=Limnobacter humi TaxID=1778671 RepID=A0ABT1WG22_9BURK|nr:hypothetical protein [Limnobacter humi]MCQ8896464.1 hypothetical protein [Limnobacter humi]
MSKVFLILHWVRKHWFVSAGLLIVGYVGVSKTIDYLTPPKEIALIIGEPWKDMQARSTARIGDDIPDEIWFRQPKDLAYLRFADPQYGFTTPPAKFFTIGFNRGKIDSIRMSPQIEPLSLQNALNVVLSLQDQWRKRGWVVTDPVANPPYEDTVEWRRKISACEPDDTYWQTTHYQVFIFISCFGREAEPSKQRYLVTLAMAKPWYEPSKLSPVERDTRSSE